MADTDEEMQQREEALVKKCQALICQGGLAKA